MKLSKILITCGVGLALSGLSALGVPDYLTLIPNSAAFSCATCHSSVPSRNAFGMAFASNGHSWNPALAGLDSDGDGFSNGVELGDPAGTWTVGAADPPGPVFNPGSSASHPSATAPSITAQPTSQTVTAGASVTFSVAATGTAPLSYQWMKNGGNIAGATTSTLALNNVTTSDAGTYTVLVSNSAGSVTSLAATLTVNPAPVGPTITAQPVSRTVTAGASVTFTVTATGTTPLSYQWMKNGGNIVGATTSTLTLNNVTTADAGSFTVLVSNSAGSVTSAAATLTVNPVVVGPTITLQPVSQTVTEGANVSFGVAASGTTPLNYQWMKDGNNITGATRANLTFTGVTLADAGSYTVLVSNSAGSVTSAAAVLTVNPAPLTVTLTSPTDGASFVAPADLTLVAAVTPSSGIASVQFFDDTNLLATITAAPYSLTVSNASLGEHVFTALVTDSQGHTALSTPVTASVLTAPPSTNAPVVRIIAPRNHASYAAPARIPLAAEASEPGGRIAQVEFYAGTTRIGTAMPNRAGKDDDEADDDGSESRAPIYILVWTGVPAGQYTVTAKATDNSGAVTTSAPVQVTVRRRPSFESESQREYRD